MTVGSDNEKLTGRKCARPVTGNWVPDNVEQTPTLNGRKDYPAPGTAALCTVTERVPCREEDRPVSYFGFAKEQVC